MAGEEGGCGTDVEGDRGKVAGDTDWETARQGLVKLHEALIRVIEVKV